MLKRCSIKKFLVLYTHQKTNIMDSCRTSKEIVKEWCENNLSTHTDWTGTRVETTYKCESVEEFVNRLWDYLEDNHLKC